MLEMIWNEKLNCYCGKINSTIRADKNGNVFGGGGSDQPQAAAPVTIVQPTQPTMQSTMADYVAAYPQLMALQQQYAPQEAALAVSLAQQYAQPLGEAYKTAQEAMYPKEAEISAVLNQQILQGMGEQVPQGIQEQYVSNLRANLGTNIGAPIGAEYTSRALLEQQKNWQDYYRNLGLSVTGRQPIAQAQTPTTTNQLAGYTPQAAMGYAQQGYGTSAGMYGAGLNYNANIYNTQSQNANQSSGWMSALGGIGGSVAGGLMGGTKPWFLGSSKRFKKNIKLWAKH